MGVFWLLLKGVKSLVYLGLRHSKNGNGCYVTLADDENYVRYTFFSKKRYGFEKGDKVVPVVELYYFDGRVNFRLVDLCEVEV